MAKKEEVLTAAQIAARRPQAAETKKRKDGSTYKVGAVYGRAAPTESPKPKTRPAPAKAKAPAKPKVDAMKGYRKGDVTTSKLITVKGEASVGDLRQPNGVKTTVKGRDGKKITSGKTTVGSMKSGYAKGGMVKKGC